MVCLGHFRDRYDRSFSISSLDGEPATGRRKFDGLPRGRPEQVANWYPEKKHGMFTYFFLKGLKGEAELDDNQKVTIREMKRYLTGENSGVPYWSRRVHQRKQLPQVVGQRPDRVLVQYEQTRTPGSQ